MKKQKNYWKKLWFLIFCTIWLIWISTLVYASWSLVRDLDNSVSTWVWANGSVTEFTVDWTKWTAYATKYANKEDNSSIIWNYFAWYYYDSVYWFFKLNWSDNESENVRIVNSTDKCDWYWYKLWWYAYSEDFWFVDFSYNDDYFVYYCVWDKKLHWYAYMENIWFQNFEWITFDINPEVTSDAIQINDDSFVNDNTEITKPEYENDKDVINWNIQYINDRKWSIFYIVK